METLHPHRWRVLAVVTLVSFLTNLDATIVIIGLAKLMEGLKLPVDMGVWMITSYLIANTVLLLPAGRWSDMIGTKRIFLAGLAIFTLATALCGLTSSGPAMIAYRFIQGLGAALAQATATPIIMRTFPKQELGLAIGINTTSWVLGSIVGPVAGGALISALGWRSIFWVAVPFAILGLFAAWLILEDTYTPVKAKTDWQGILTFGAGLTAFLIVLSEGQAWGWGSSPIIGLLLATVLLWGVFVITELRVKHPLFNFKLLANRQYAAGLGITLNYCIGYFAITFLLTLYLQGALHLSPFDSGLLLLPLSVPQLIMGPLGGKLADRFGPLRQLLTGSLLLSSGLYLLGNLGVQLSVMSIVFPLLIISVANGMAWPALAKAILSTAPREQAGEAAGMFYTVYNVGRTLSQVFVLIIVQFSIPPATVSQALTGIAAIQDQLIINALVCATNTGFNMLIVFFTIALLLTSLLLYQQKRKTSVLAKL